MILSEEIFMVRASKYPLVPQHNIKLENSFSE
jgi:hypothetical protein